MIQKQESEGVNIQWQDSHISMHWVTEYALVFYQVCSNEVKKFEKI
jgi:hypothetical protein